MLSTPIRIRPSRSATSIARMVVVDPRLRGEEGEREHQHGDDADGQRDGAGGVEGGDDDDEEGDEDGEGGEQDRVVRASQAQRRRARQREHRAEHAEEGDPGEPRVANDPQLDARDEQKRRGDGEREEEHGGDEGEDFANEDATHRPRERGRNDAACAYPAKGRMRVVVTPAGAVGHDRRRRGSTVTNVAVGGARAS